MMDGQERMRDIAHLGHVEVLTPRPDETLQFFTEVLGMDETVRRGESVYLRAWGDYDRHTLKVTASAQAGLGHMGWRAMSPQALQRCARALEESGRGLGWVEGDLGHGPAYRFADPDGHLMEVYYESERYRAPQELRPKLLTLAHRYRPRGAAVRRLDHVNLMCRDVRTNRLFLQDTLGFHLREHLVPDDGVEAGAWISVTPLVHDIAYVRDFTGHHGRLHHVAYWLDNREDLLRAADLFVEEGVFLEAGPAKHNVTQAFFIYVYEPGGNRVELFTGGYLIFAPDWEPVTWTSADRGTGVYWGGALPQSFRTYGTPVVEAPAVVPAGEPVFDPV